MASEAVKTGKVRLGDDEVKPSREIRKGDLITIRRQGALFSYLVVEELEKRVGAKLVIDYLEDITEPEELEKFRLYQESQKAYREQGFGRPSKKDRRKIDRYLGK